MRIKDHRNSGHRGPVAQWEQRTSGTVGREDQWSSGYREPEEQWVQRNSGYRGPVEQWV